MRATNSAVLIYGDTGTGKTSLLATAAEYCWRRFKKKTRYYAGDLGGYNDNMLALQAAGIVEVWRFQSRDPDSTRGLAIGTCALITQGYWPKEGTWDPETGMSEVAGELVAPAATWYVMKCKSGHTVKRGPSQTLLMPGPCPTCRVPTSKESCGGVEKELVADESFKDVGLVVYDSLTAMGEWGMSEMNHRAGQGSLGGLKGALSTIVSSGVSFGSAGMSAVGFMQGRVQDWPRNAVNIPGLVLPPIFTALEQKATDDANLPLYGPNIPGKAKTADVSSWFGNTLGTVTVLDGARQVHRLYLETYTTDKDSIPHRCKSRVSPGALPPYLQDPEGATVANGQSFTVFSLGHLFTLLEEAQKAAEETTKAKYPDAPGMGRKVEIGKKAEAGTPAAETKSATVSQGGGGEGTGEVAKAPSVSSQPPVGHGSVTGNGPSVAQTPPTAPSPTAPPRPSGPPTRTVSAPPSVGRPKGVVPGPRGTVVATVK